MEIEFAQESKIGNRAVNQDYLAHLVEADFAFFVVADGLGGHEAGEEASRLFCEALIQLLNKYKELIHDSPVSGMEKLIFNATAEMSKQLLSLDHPDARTTCAALWLDESKLITAHIGDSRIYRVTDRGIVWRSYDHSMLQQLLDTGQIFEEEASQHPSQSVLLRTISSFERPEPDIYILPPLQKNEILLLCTDGFWQYVNKNEIESLIHAKDLPAALDNLIELCLKRSSPQSDNVTAQVIRIS